MMKKPKLSTSLQPQRTVEELKNLRDLTADVAPNGTYTFTLDMRAPTGDGTYTTGWAIHLEDGSTCALNLTINVTR